MNKTTGVDRGNPRRYFSADLHLNHANIIKYCNRNFCLSDFEIATIEAIQETTGETSSPEVRSFRISTESVEIMNELILKNINAIVGREDIFYLLGDFCFAKDFAIVKKFRNMINCKNIHFVMGNHDKFSNREYLSIFETVDYYKEFKYNGIKFVLSHYPFLEWAGSFYGSIHLFGHCHGNKNDKIAKMFPSAKMLDVGIDSHDYKPWSIEEIIKNFN